jgi:hypothetical protein
MMKSGLVLGYEQEKRIPYITVHDEVGGAVVDEQDAKSNKSWSIVWIYASPYDQT